MGAALIVAARHPRRRAVYNVPQERLYAFSNLLAMTCTHVCVIPILDAWRVL